MDLSELNRRLVANAFLFDDPHAYAAGVTDALDAVRRLLQWDGIVWGARDRRDVEETRIGVMGPWREPR
ncbi:MAG: hypothetical protein M3N32_05830 [Actinomycetota bacterium]|nr:hypothetical protein [Actinomycetota bacterium]